MVHCNNYLPELSMDVHSFLRKNVEVLNNVRIQFMKMKDTFNQLKRNSLQNGNIAQNQIILNALQLETKKLIHRVTILNRNSKTSATSIHRHSFSRKFVGCKLISGGATEYTATVQKFQMMNIESCAFNVGIQEALTEIFKKAVKLAYPMVNDNNNIPVTPSDSQFGDYQCNAAMALCKNLKSLGIKESPQKVAKEIVDKLPKNELIEKIEVAGPGFINIYLKDQYLAKRITDIVINGLRPPKGTKSSRVVVDFSSPNVAKEMHVGHLRSTIIGDSICNLFEYLGHYVLRLNHLGDWGTQFGMLIAHLQDMYPDYLQKSPSVDNLQRFYKESKIRFDTDEDFRKRAYESVVKLQQFDKSYIKAWQLICDASRKEFQKIYDRLDVRIIERGESFYQEYMKKMVEELFEKGLLEDDEGRKIMWGAMKESERTIPLTIVKSDGGYTYDTSDLAALKHRCEEEKADQIIYVVDEGQAIHFQQIESCAIRAGYFDPNRSTINFVGFGVVVGEDNKKFKTRSGDTVKLVELLDEGLKRALEKLKEKKRDEVLTAEELKSAQEAIAYGCIKYADLSHNRNHSYMFSFDKMLDDKGNTAVYLLYAYTRIASIVRAADINEENVKKLAERAPIDINHPKELKLAKVILQFYDVVQRAAQDLALHRLCEYLYELSTTFSEFYDNCYVIEKNSAGEITKIHMHRVMLCNVTATVMKNVFHILGLKTVSRM